MNMWAPFSSSKINTKNTRAQKKKDENLKTCEEKKSKREEDPGER